MGGMAKMSERGVQTELQLYLREVNQVRLLTADEEKQIAAAAKMEAASLLAEHPVVKVSQASC